LAASAARSESPIAVIISVHVLQARETAAPGFRHGRKKTRGNIKSYRGPTRIGSTVRGKHPACCASACAISPKSRCRPTIVACTCEIRATVHRDPAGRSLARQRKRSNVRDYRCRINMASPKFST